MNGNFEDNRVNITGEIISEAVFEHRAYGENFYKFYVKVGRLSGACDFLPVIISERLIDISGNYIGDVITSAVKYGNQSISILFDISKLLMIKKSYHFVGIFL